MCRYTTYMESLTLRQQRDLATYLADVNKNINKARWNVIITEAHAVLAIKYGWKSIQNYGTIAAGLSENATHFDVIYKWVRNISDNCLPIGTLCQILDDSDCLDDTILKMLNYECKHNKPIWAEEEVKPVVTPVQIKPEDVAALNAKLKKCNDEITALQSKIQRTKCRKTLLKVENTRYRERLAEVQNLIEHAKSVNEENAQLRTQLQATECNDTIRRVNIQLREQLEESQALIEKLNQEITATKEMCSLYIDVNTENGDNIKRLERENNELKRRVLQFECAATLQGNVQAKQPRWTLMADGGYIYDGIRINIPPQTAPNKHDWTHLSEYQKNTLASNIASVLNNVVCQFDISMSTLSAKLPAGCSGYTHAVYFVNMMATIGKLDAIQDVLMMQLKGVAARANREMGFPE